MSKRLQIVVPDDEYRAVARLARRRGRPVAQIVRESLRRTVAEEDDQDPDRRIAAVLRFARFAGPSGDIDQILAEIERGRGTP
ncbi:MAG: ribbon-helix-helix protein, CopG family [Proteobacteria bacterium]|nr:ribbon-helix-helix protein, CopG family [Pseudomonadota bacterium]